MDVLEELQKLTAVLVLLSKGDQVMPWDLIIQLLLPLLKSLLEKEKAALKAGFDGPLTSYFKAQDAGAGNEAAMKAAAQSYARCCDLPPPALAA